jgi:hypothetical protein
MKKLLEIHQKLGIKLTNNEETGGKSLIIWENLLTFLREVASIESDFLIDDFLVDHEISKHNPGYQVNQMISRSVINGEFVPSIYRNMWYNLCLGARGSYRFNSDFSTYLAINSNKQESVEKENKGDTKSKKTKVKTETSPKPVSSLFRATLDQVVDMCHLYFQTMVWCLDYYSGIPVSSDLFYFYAKSPLLGDLVNYLDNIISNELTENLEDVGPQDTESDMTPILQLLCVIPRDSVLLLPVEVRTLCAVDSPIADLYPVTFDIEVMGNQMAMFDKLPEQSIANLNTVGEFTKSSYNKSMFEGDSNRRRNKYDSIFIPPIDVERVNDTLITLEFPQQVIDNKTIYVMTGEQQKRYEYFLSISTGENRKIVFNTTNVTQRQYGRGRGNVRGRGRGNRGGRGNEGATIAGSKPYDLESNVRGKISNKNIPSIRGIRPSEIQMITQNNRSLFQENSST